MAVIVGVGDVQPAPTRLTGWPTGVSLPPDVESQRARWREKAKRREERRLAALGVDGRRAVWAAKAARRYADDPQAIRDKNTRRRRRLGARPLADWHATNVTIVGVGDLRCERCCTPFTRRPCSPQQRFCSPSCRRRSQAADQVRIRYRLRARVIAASGGTCYLCTRSIDETLKAPHPLSLSIDHVKPLALGGGNELGNLRATHLACNVEKGDQLPPWWIVP